MKLLFINESPLVLAGGVYHTTEAWTRLPLFLAEHAEQVTLLAPVRPEAAAAPAATHWPLPRGAIRIEGLGDYNSYASYYRQWPWRRRGWFDQADRLVAEHDLVIHRFPSPIAPIISACVRRRKKPLVCFVCGDLATQVDGLVSSRGLKRWLYRLGVAYFLRQEAACCAGASLIYAYSKDIARRHGGAGPVRLMQDPHLRDSDIKVRADTCAGPEIVLVRACWVIPSKGLETLLKATAELRRRGLPVRLEIAGRERQAGYQASLEDLAARLGVADKVRFLGWVPYDKILELLDRSDIHVVSSLGEGSPRVLAESFARGLPSVCTAVGGCGDILEHERDALLVPPEDPGAMADQIERLIRDGELRRRLIARGYEVVGGLTFETLGMRIVADLRSLCGGDAGSSPG